MKKILLLSIFFAALFATACKKENLKLVDPKKEINKLKNKIAGMVVKEWKERIPMQGEKPGRTGKQTTAKFYADGKLEIMRTASETETASWQPVTTFNSSAEEKLLITYSNGKTAIAEIKQTPAAEVIQFHDVTTGEIIELQH